MISERVPCSDATRNWPPSRDLEIERFRRRPAKRHPGTQCRFTPKRVTDGSAQSPGEIQPKSTWVPNSSRGNPVRFPPGLLSRVGRLNEICGQKGGQAKTLRREARDGMGPD